MKVRAGKALVALSVAVFGLSIPGAPTANGATTVVTFSYTGSSQSWSVPAGVNAIQFRVVGATGGASWSNRGGYGESITGTLAVTPGENLQINVGQRGSGHSSGTNAAAFNGGGQGYYYGAGGGGASDIRKGGSSLANRVVVAGGGGGAGNSIGANAGFLIGETGADAGLSGSGMNAGGGGGGTQSAGGVGGTTSTMCGGAGSDGALGVGGNGSASSAGGGGGGGGFYGGGGGGAGCNSTSGGGGSSYIDSILVTNSQNSLNQNISNGSIVISYTILTFATVGLATTSGVAAQYRKAFTIRVTVSSPGRITFFANGKKIPGCISKAVSSTFDCTFKPATRGVLSIYSSFTPTGDTELANKSSVLQLPVGVRSTYR